MIIKHIGNKLILGAQLTPREQQALDIEIRKAYAEMNRKNANEIDAMFLWWAHRKLGFGHDRLKQLHNDFAPELKALCERYEMNDPGDDIWLCTKKLMDIGVDVAKWNEEISKHFVEVI